jgi:plasmid stability protein
MAELHLTNVDEDVLARLRDRAQQAGISLEEQICTLLEQGGEEEGNDGSEASQTLRMPPSDRSFRDVDPVEAPGISASELLIRDRRR